MPRFCCHFEHPSRDIVHETGYVTKFLSILVLIFGVTRTTVHLTHRCTQRNLWFFGTEQIPLVCA